MFENSPAGAKESVIRLWPESGVGPAGSSELRANFDFLLLVVAGAARCFLGFAIVSLTSGVLEALAVDLLSACFLTAVDSRFLRGFLAAGFASGT